MTSSRARCDVIADQSENDENVRRRFRNEILRRFAEEEEEGRWRGAARFGRYKNRNKGHENGRKTATFAFVPAIDRGGAGRLPIGRPGRKDRHSFRWPPLHLSRLPLLFLSRPFWLVSCSFFFFFFFLFVAFASPSIASFSFQQNGLSLSFFFFSCGVFRTVFHVESCGERQKKTAVESIPFLFFFSLIRVAIRLGRPRVGQFVIRNGPFSHTKTTQKKTTQKEAKWPPSRLIYPSDFDEDQWSARNIFPDFGTTLRALHFLLFVVFFCWERFVSVPSPSTTSLGISLDSSAPSSLTLISLWSR